MTSYEREYYDQAELWEKDLLCLPAEQERITSTIESIPSDVLTVLDVGCGNGSFLNALPDGYQAVGLDSSQVALKYVKTKAIHGDIAALPFEPASFDIITCLEVIEHLSLDSLEKALAEIQRVSNKYIIISVPNDEDLDYSLVICSACRCRYNPSRHVQSFDSEKLRALFKQFVLLGLKEIGPLEPRPQYKRSLYTAYRLWNNTAPPSMAVCPQCGYQPIVDESSVSPVKSGTLLSYTLMLLKFFAKIIWRPKQRRRWLLALYVRKDLEATITKPALATVLRKDK